MPDLIHSLQGHDLGHVRIIAQAWGIELQATDVEKARAEIAAALRQPGVVPGQLEALPADAREALVALRASDGRIPWPAFARRFGEVREMGAGRRDRERPYLHPESSAEFLFYRGLLARAFFDTDAGPREFAYIPDDLLVATSVAASQLGARDSSAAPATEALGRLAGPAERAIVLPATDRILDDATTLLAARRAGVSTEVDSALAMLLQAAGLLRRDTPQAPAVKRFLEMPRARAMDLLFEAWRAAENFSELRMLPGLTFEGEWTEPRLRTRAWLLESLERIRVGDWWSLTAFIQDIKRHHPEYQRPAGDFDSWFIRRDSDGTYLRGFGAWEEVDGALVRLFITKVLHRLEAVDLAYPAAGAEATAFRRVDRAKRGPRLETGTLKMLSDGRVTAQRNAPRAVRYQLARFCEWLGESPDEFKYRITPRSLAAARSQGLHVIQMLPLLAKYGDTRIPPALLAALKRWGAKGTEARAENQVVLRVRSPEVLVKLRKSKAARFLGEVLGPTAVVIRAGAQTKVMAALAELGVLGDDATSAPAVYTVREQAGQQRSGS